MWLTSDEALERLAVKPQTLYANVSRGRVRAKPDPKDPRRSLYNAQDIERLAAKAPGRPRVAAVASETLRWGEPVLETAISTIVDGRLYYRGQDAVGLAQSATLEQVAHLLWQSAGTPEVDPRTGQRAGTAELLAALAERAAVDAPSHGRAASALAAEAASVFGTIAGVLCDAGGGVVHDRLARRWQAPEGADALRRALVLLADHELNASTFAARVAVSTGASLAAGALAGLATLSGPLHGTAAGAVFALARRAGEVGAGAAIRERLAEGRALPAFGHPLYPDGDPRGVALTAAFEMPAAYRELAEAAEPLIGEKPNVDFALAALVAAFRLPETAPLAIFALARSVGWLAHMLEQAQSGTLIRPRARYTGPRPSVV